MRIVFQFRHTRLVRCGGLAPPRLAAETFKVSMATLHQQREIYYANDINSRPRNRLAGNRGSRSRREIMAGINGTLVSCTDRREICQA